MICSLLFFFYFFHLSFCQITPTTTKYDYTTHGANWNVSVCLTGARQSPINLTDYKITTYANIHYFFAKYSSAISTANYYNVSLEILANDLTLGYGNLLTVVPDSSGSNRAFMAQSILFRSPAEHIIGGVRYPLEVQIYHKLEKLTLTQYAVVSLFFNYSNNESDFLSNIITNNQSNQQTFNVDLSTLISFSESDDMEYWAYAGSFTMPTCDQTANWYLMKKIFNATNDQINFFVNLYHNNTGFLGDGNYRDIQTGNRTKSVTVMDFQRT